MAQAALSIDAPRSAHPWWRRHAPLLLTLLFILPAVLPLSAPGYFMRAHDARHSIFWIAEYDQAVRDGVLWPVWAPDHALGFGYPVWLVYAPLAYVIAELFHLAGLGFAAAAKATWALGFLLGALGSYRLARRWWGPAAGMVAALAFTYAPYHLVQIYVRADLAEFLAWSWFPWVLLAYVNLWARPGPRTAGLAGLALGALLFLHTVSPLFFAPVLAAFLLLKLVQTWRAAGRFPARWLLWTLAATGLGGVLVMAFLLPGLFELRYVMQSQYVRGNYDYIKQFVYPSQFFSPYWGFGYAEEGPNDHMSFQLGLLPLLAGGLGAWLALRGPAVRRRATAGRLPGREQGKAEADAPTAKRWRPPGLSGRTISAAAGQRVVASEARLVLPQRAEALLMAAMTAAAVFLMTPAAAPIWRALPFGSLIQFPWRLLALTMVTLAMLAAAATWWLDRAESPGHRKRAAPLSPAACLLALLVVLAGLPYTAPELQPLRPLDETPLAVVDFEMTYKDMRGLTAWSQRMLMDTDSPLLAQYAAGQPLQRAAILTGQGTILAQASAAASASARVRADAPLRLRFYTYYFPGWTATVDGRPAAIQPDPPLGLIGLDLPPGEHEVRLRFTSTPIRRLGGALSLAALAACLVLVFYRNKPVSLPGGPRDRRE